MSNPHDSLFKQVLSQPERAAAFVRRFLPPPVVEALDVERLTVVPGSFVDEALESRHTDLLLAVPRTGCTGEDAAVLVYVLLEHQSSVDRWMARRMLRYVDRVWSRWEAEHPEARELPVVVPLVVYQGERAWSAPTALHGLVAWGDAPSLQEALSPQVPGLSFLLMDLRRTADGAQALGQHVRLVPVHVPQPPRQVLAEAHPGDGLGRRRQPGDGRVAGDLLAAPAPPADPVIDRLVPVQQADRVGAGFVADRHGDDPVARLEEVHVRDRARLRRCQ